MLDDVQDTEVGTSRDIVLSIIDGRPVAWNMLPGEEIPSLVGHQGNITNISWSRDGSKLLSSSEDATAIIWNAYQGKKLVSFDEHISQIHHASWSPDDNYVATVGQDKTLRVWNATDGSLLATREEHKGPVYFVEWRPTENGHHLLTAGANNQVIVWEFTPPASISVGEVLEGGKSSIDFTQAHWNKDGTYIAGLTSDQYEVVQLWNKENSANFIKYNILTSTNKVADMKWHPEGTQLVTSNVNGLSQIWDVANKMPLKEMNLPLASIDRNHAVWSPSGDKILLTGNDGDGLAVIWDAQTGDVIHELAGHRKTVTWASWSPNGDYVVTTSDDHTARVWNVATGQLQSILTGHSDKVTQAVWSPDGQRIATASEDNTIRIYYAFIEDLTKQVCERIDRNMTDTEWQDNMSTNGYEYTCTGKPKPANQLSYKPRSNWFGF
ncbi:MAG: WD40 repeat domain-containing protein [Chloroflexota bacterium]